jgi:hypothetical protein
MNTQPESGQRPLVTVLQTLLQTFWHPQSHPKIPQKKSQIPHTTPQSSSLPQSQCWTE